jgi:hypothetical protein
MPQGWHGNGRDPSVSLCAEPDQETAAARRALTEELRDAMAGFANPALEGPLAAGVAYHHAGLTAQERHFVEVWTGTAAPLHACHHALPWLLIRFRVQRHPLACVPTP